MYTGEGGENVIFFVESVLAQLGGTADSTLMVACPGECDCHIWLLL